VDFGSGWIRPSRAKAGRLFSLQLDTLAWVYACACMQDHSGDDTETLLCAFEHSVMT
jgi:hypothetical protein